MEKAGISILVLFIIGSNVWGQIQFTDVTQEAKINHQYIVYEGFFGGGLSVLDFNKDGFEDVFLTGGMGENQLLLNKGNGTFLNVFKGSGLEKCNEYVTIGVAIADVNKDGLVDLFITTSAEKGKENRIPRAPNLLFINNGDLTFRDATKEFGLQKYNSFSTGASFGDFNGDGYPDLYVGNYFLNYEGTLKEISDETIVNSSNISEDYLFLNHKGKQFKNVYKKYGLNHQGFGFGGTFTDYDNDGDLDFLVINDFGYKAKPNYVLRNELPENSFYYAESETGLDLRINAMSAAVGDFNDDGLKDYFITNIKFNRFMVQNSGRFEDKSVELGTSFFTISWGANFGDFDNDGDLDLFVLNGDLNPNTQPMGSFLFENNNYSFKDIAFFAGINDYGIGRGSIAFDYDNDGDLDLMVVNQAAIKEGYPVESVTRLYRNDSPPQNWIKIKLEGAKSDYNGLGSTVQLFIKGKKVIREVDGGGSSHLSQNSPIVHFGLGSNLNVDSIIIKWIGGNPQVLISPTINQLVTVKQVEMHNDSSKGFPFWVLPIVIILYILVSRKIR